MKRLELRPWEYVLIAFAIVLFLVSLAAYLEGFPLRNYVFNLPAEETEDDAIGKVSTVTGTLKREVLGQSDFKVISKDASVYGRDTVVTGPDGKATIVLNDGSTIELGPRTMVKLEGEERPSLLGVTRTTRVDVVTGQVTGKASASASEEKKRRVVIRTRDDEFEVEPTQAPKVVKVSATRPVVPPPRKVEELGASSILQKFVKTLTAPVAEQAPKPELIPTKPVAPSPKPVALRPSPSPSPKPSPSPSPKPSPSPSPSPSPKPSPSPIAVAWKIQVISPASGAQYRLDKTTIAGKPIPFTWKLNVTNMRKAPKGAVALTLKLYGVKDGTRTSKPLIEKVFVTHYGQVGTHTWLIKKPGQYDLDISGPDASKSTVTSHFSLENNFEGIELLQPEAVDFSKMESLQTRGRKNAKVRLSWKPFPTAQEYKLQIFDPAAGDDKPQEIPLKETNYVVARKTAEQSEASYQVSATLPNGVTVRSPKGKFIFDFPPPDPSTPANRSTISAQEMEAWEGGVLLTWQQTGVSEGYVIEIARDAAFKNVVAKRSIKDNFFMFRPIANVHQYWWRVSAHAQQLTSRPSAVFQFTTTGKGGAKSAAEASQSQIKEQDD